MSEDHVPRTIEDALLHLWAVVNDLSAIPMPEPPRYRVTIFGSSRIKPDDYEYKEVARLAAELARMGCDIVSGGGPGMMQAANEGAQRGDPDNRSSSIGVPVTLPFEEKPNPFIEDMFHHRTFFTRLHHFVRLSSAYVVVPGGIGTTLETAMIWQLLQVKHIHDRPLILVGSMWKEFVAWARQNMLSHQPPLINPEDADLPICVATVDEALAVLREHRSRRKRA
jgi:hypothetical protein